MGKWGDVKGLNPPPAAGVRPPSPASLLHHHRRIDRTCGAGERLQRVKHDEARGVDLHQRSCARRNGRVKGSCREAIRTELWRFTERVNPPLLLLFLSVPTHSHGLADGIEVLKQLHDSVEQHKRVACKPACPSPSSQPAPNLLSLFLL